jgi:hypothetical protein
MKVLVYADTVREARNFYPTRAGQAVGYRVAGEFDKPEKADLVLYAKEYTEIEAAYLGDKPKKKKK